MQTIIIIVLIVYIAYTNILHYYEINNVIEKLTNTSNADKNYKPKSFKNMFRKKILEREQRIKKK